MRKILIAAPVNNRAWCLRDFLQSIRELTTPDDCEISYYFLENDSTDDSLDVLSESTAKWEHCAIESVHNDLPEYDRTGPGGHAMYTRMAQLRNRIRLYAVNSGYDYLFSVDSDIMLQPDTLKRLLAHSLHFVAATISNSGSHIFSCVNALGFIEASGSGPYSDPPIWHRIVPEPNGVKQVGGTGAVFLASRAILEANTYLYEVLKESKYYHPQILPVYGEDYQFAMCCGDRGWTQHIDFGIRAWHCYTKDLLEIYNNARTKYKTRAVKVITDRAWLGLDKSLLVPSCETCKQNRKRG